MFNFFRKPVVFVEEGMTPDEVMRAAKNGQFVNKNSSSDSMAIIKAVGGIIGVAVFLYIGYATFIKKPTPQPTTSPVVVATTPTKTATLTPIQTPIVTITIQIITPTPTTTPTPSSTPTNTPAIVSDSLFNSFISPLATPTATPTPATDYILTYTNTTPIDPYPVIAGYLLEMDGQTARPDKIKLCHPTGCMHYPRPNNTDISNGYYEFLVEPGTYDLLISNLIVPITVYTTPLMYQLNFKYTKAQTLTTAARSNPWGEYNKDTTQTTQTTRTPNTPTPTATRTTRTPTTVYLPFITKLSQTSKNTQPIVKDKKRYFPLIIKNNEKELKIDISLKRINLIYLPFIRNKNK